ncbi:MAG TPA: CDP-diacylglycerol--serine O-phosphatidyltransferase [Blastocatellia bacterium]|nr:CDP-diacylglycerol--serine O-phosphatidyltransferase [Blastocatellia bacterium]
MRLRAPARHFSMIRSFHLADLFTIANGLCGMVAIFEAMKFLRSGDEREAFAAAVLIPIALVFDLLDGRIARWRHMSSALGRELDSLADMISFGVAPAAIAFAVGLNTWLDQIILIFFAICGLSRLARYNITADSLSASTGRVEYFEGTPIPTSVIPLGLLMILFYKGNLYPARLFGVVFHWPVALFLISGSLMVSRTIRIPKP